MYVISVRARRGVCADPRPEIVFEAPRKCVCVWAVCVRAECVQRGVCVLIPGQIVCEIL